MSAHEEYDARRAAKHAAAVAAARALCAEWARGADIDAAADALTDAVQDLDALDALGPVVPASAAAADECRWRASALAWRGASRAWQEWAGDLLRQTGRQPEGGEWGDGPAREIIADLARRGAALPVPDATPAPLAAPATAEEWAAEIGRAVVRKDKQYGSQWRTDGYVLGTWANVLRKIRRLQTADAQGEPWPARADILRDLAGYCGLFLGGSAAECGPALASALVFRGLPPGRYAVFEAQELAAAHYPENGGVLVFADELRGLYQRCAAACLVELAYGDAALRTDRRPHAPDRSGRHGGRPGSTRCADPGMLRSARGAARGCPRDGCGTDGWGGA
jgi:hypothetical protein